VEAEAEEEDARPSKSQRLEDDEVLGVELMEVLEEVESDTIHLVSAGGSMPLITCDEPLDLSFLDTDYARDLSEAMACSRFGEVRQALSDQAAVFMMTELCADKETADPVGASIFDHDSSRGLELGETEDHWTRDVAAGTWTRVMVVPRSTMLHPSEGEGRPALMTWSGKRSTIPLSVEAKCDNWKAANYDDALLGGRLWTGKCVFNESWDDMTDDAQPDSPGLALVDPIASVAKMIKEVSAVAGKDKEVDLPNGLVFTNLAEYSLVDDLTGEALEGHLVTMAKREELTEVYRRTVWTEA